MSTLGQDIVPSLVRLAGIDGVALEGGKGTVAFTVVGALILALIQNIMNLAGLASYPQYVVKGAIIIILAIFLSKLGSKNV